MCWTLGYFRDSPGETWYEALTEIWIFPAWKPVFALLNTTEGLFPYSTHSSKYAFVYENAGGKRKQLRYSHPRFCGGMIGGLRLGTGKQTPLSLVTNRIGGYRCKMQQPYCVGTIIASTRKTIEPISDAASFFGITVPTFQCTGQNYF